MIMRMTDPSETKRFQRRRVLLAGVVIFALFSVIFGVTAFISRTSGPNLRAKLDAIRAVGEPVTGAELDAWYPTPPASENAATVYVEAFSLLSKDEKLKSKVHELAGEAGFDPKGPVSVEHRVAYEDYLAVNRAALAKIKTASAMRESRYPVGFGASKMWLVELKYLPSIRHAAKLLSFDAKLAATDGDAPRVVDDIVQMLRLADSIRREPILVSQLVRASVIGMVHDCIEDSLNRADLNDEQLRMLADEVKMSLSFGPDSQVRAMIGERAFGISLFEIDSAEFYEMYGHSRKGWTSIHRSLSGVRAADEDEYLDLMNAAVAAVKLPRPAQMLHLEAIGTKADAKPTDYVMCPGVGGTARSANSFVNADTGLLVTRVGLCVLRYRLAHAGALPEKLDALVPEFLDAVPADPFDGKPLRYVRLAKGFSVYSIGADKVDDGGDGKDVGRDVVFVVGR